ncbi:MAG: cytochrome c3 family protein [Actinomycetes bacterium]
MAFVAASSDEIHGPLTDPTNTGSCALCHRSHSAQTPGFLGSTGPTQTALCYTCHDGTGSPDLQGPNVKDQFAIAPPNVVTATSRSFYSHDVSALATKAHEGALVDSEGGETVTDEFGGVVNRHSECSDCHNPHASYIDPPTTDVSKMTPNGWTLSGRDYATPGVQADYTGVAAGAVPALTLLDGTSQPLTTEYQLCYKCHSSYTQLPSNVGMDATSMIYDQAVEFNPANPSYHPVTAAGKNQTTAMKNSLRNASGPRLLWNFQSTDTIRCTNCHSQPSVSNTNGGAGQNSATHGSFNKFLLLRRYEASTNGTSSVDGTDYDLCFGCHSDQPFSIEGSADTNWADHYLHVSQENLRCAECHGEIHSSTNVAGQVGYSRLIKFGPDVTAATGASPIWTALTSGGVQNGGTCTLVCHGTRHSGGAKFSYRYTP